MKISIGASSGSQSDGSIFVHKLPVSSASVIPLTLQAKIEPLFTAQTILGTNVAKLNSELSVTASKIIDHTKSFLPSITESARSLSTTLSEMNRLAIDTGALSKTTAYDFIHQPFVSTLNTIADSVKINQNSLSSYLSNAATITSQVSVAPPEYIRQISSLGEISLDYLRASPSISTLVIKPEETEIDTLKKKVGDLESKVEKLESENRSLTLTTITSDVAKKLESIDPDLAKRFRGAITTLMANENEDLVGQVAESLTRVIEELPFALAPNVAFSSENKKRRMTEALGSYLKIPNQELDSHHLILQQKSYYDILGNIRHRKKSAYKMYNQDRALFKAFVVQVEAYVYILITFK